MVYLLFPFSPRAIEVTVGMEDIERDLVGLFGIGDVGGESGGDRRAVLDGDVGTDEEDGDKGEGSKICGLRCKKAAKVVRVP